MTPSTARQIGTLLLVAPLTFSELRNQWDRQHSTELCACTVYYTGLRLLSSFPALLFPLRTRDHKTRKLKKTARESNSGGKIDFFWLTSPGRREGEGKRWFIFANMQRSIDLKRGKKLDSIIVQVQVIAFLPARNSRPPPVGKVSLIS